MAQNIQPAPQPPHISITQDSIATYLRHDGLFYDIFIAKFLLHLPSVPIKRISSASACK